MPWLLLRLSVKFIIMPPWLADPHYSEFVNDRRLSQKEIDTIVAWVDGRHTPDIESIYAQHILASGVVDAAWHSAGR